MKVISSFMQACLLVEVFGFPAAEDDPFFLSDSGLDPLNGEDDMKLLTGPEFPVSANGNSPPTGLDLGSNLFDASLGESLPLDQIAMLPEGSNVDDDFDSITSSHPSCTSDEGLSIIGRRGDTCSEPTLLQEPSIDVTNPPNTVFPPPGSNPNRQPGELNDLKSRPSRFVANSPFDFEYCRSGHDGYREYVVCDSDVDEERSLMSYGPFHALFHCTRRKQTSEFSSSSCQLSNLE